MRETIRATPPQAVWPPRGRATALILLACLLAAIPAWAAMGQGTVDQGGAVALQPGGEGAGSGVPWWVWPLVLFVFCLALGTVTVVAGVGGGVLYVPLVAAFFPFHVDFVRATGLLIGLAGALAAGPGLLKHGLGKLRLVLPCALMGSVGSYVGARVGLAIPSSAVHIILGVCILGVTALMLFSRNVEYPKVDRCDRLGQLLHIHGSYREHSVGEHVQWCAHRTPLGMLLFTGVGFIGGLLGLGAGWANVPLLNLVMGVPLKVAVGSSVFMLSVTNTTASWVYLNQGAWLPIIAVPSIIGLMLGTSLGVKVLGRSRPRYVRSLVVIVLLFAAVSSLLKGLGVWS